MRQATIYFILLYPLVPLAWTALALRVGGYEATITAVVRESCAERPLYIVLASVFVTSLSWHWWGGGY